MEKVFTTFPLPSLMVIDPVLEDHRLELDATLYATVPLAVPPAPEVIEIQEAVLWAVHAHELPAVTLKLPDPLLLENDLLVGLME